jgi:hypothetical protein
VKKDDPAERRQAITASRELFEALFNLIGPERAREFLAKIQSATQEQSSNSSSAGGNDGTEK